MIVQRIIYFFNLLYLCHAACRPSSTVSSGFNVTAYGYPLGSYAGWEADFLLTGYKQFGEWWNVEGVTSPNFDEVIPNTFVIYGDLYDQNITISNFTLELTGYFIPEETGDYIFEITDADDGAALSINTEGPCCEDADLDPSVWDIITLRELTDPYGTAASESVTATLEEGLAYAIKVVVFNWDGPLALQMQYTSPSKVVYKTFESVFQVKFNTSDQNCLVSSYTTTTTTEFTDTEYSTPGTYTPTDCSDKETCTVIVVEPHTTTTTTEFTNSKYSTPGTYTPTDCSDEETCAVIGTSKIIPSLTPLYPNVTSSSLMVGSSYSESLLTIPACVGANCDSSASTGVSTVATTTLKFPETSYSTQFTLPLSSVNNVKSSSQSSRSSGKPPNPVSESVSSLVSDSTVVLSTGFGISSLASARTDSSIDSGSETTFTSTRIVQSVSDPSTIYSASIETVNKGLSSQNRLDISILVIVFAYCV